MVTPLVFRHGPAEVAFTVLLLTWAVFETALASATCGVSWRSPCWAAPGWWCGSAPRNGS